MYRNLFTAWYCLGVLGLILVTFCIAAPLIGPDRAQAAFALYSLLAFLPVFWYFLFRKEPNDERDVSFLQRASFFGFGNAFVVLFVLNAMLDYLYRVEVGSDSVPLDVFWLPSVCALIIGLLTASVMLLLFYYKGENADKEG